MIRIKYFCLFLIMLAVNCSVSASEFFDQKSLAGNSISVAVFPVEINFGLSGDKKSVSFEAKNISSFNKLNYEILYSCSLGERQIVGEAEINGETKISRENLVLGTCSGDNCVYDEGIAKIKLNIKLTKPDGIVEDFEREITP